MITKGRTCVKIAGRDTGVCVVLEVDKEKSRFKVYGPKGRER